MMPSLAALQSKYDLKTACARCSVREAEVTYVLKAAPHPCANDLLLCKDKRASKWRPVSRRPAFPNPSRYVVCDYFAEGSGCRQHQNRCTFARSEEEAAVWNFEKQQRLDRSVLIGLLRGAEGGADPPHTHTAELLETLDLKVVCDQCSVKEREITYSINSRFHKCSKNQILARVRGGSQWRPVSERPSRRHCGRNVLYQVCRYFVEDCGCRVHGADCSFARSYEEATVWNYVREKDMSREKLIRLVSERQRGAASPESAAQSLLQEFPGEFIELCKDCFQERPQKISMKRWNNTCSADAAHPWEPILVFHQSENSRKHVYSKVRPLPPNCDFEYCSHVKEGKPCWHPAGRCTAAQSEVEMAVWRAESAGLSVRPRLLQLCQGQRTATREVSMYCRVCLLVLSSPESFFQHCSSPEHARLLSADADITWKGRPPPPHARHADFWLCDRPVTCEYGKNCPKAHSESELKEWMMRTAEEKEVRQNMEAEGLMSYNEKLLDEYRSSSNNMDIVSENIDDVHISCDSDLTVDCPEVHSKVQWNFQVETERQVVHVALLKQEPGATFTLDENSFVPCIHRSGDGLDNEDTIYDIKVTFTCTNPGLYEQWLVLDFGMRPVLLQQLRVRVGQPSLEEGEQANVTFGPIFKNVERWHRGNRIILPCLSRTEDEHTYKPPQMTFEGRPSGNNSETTLTPGNYKEVMHDFLYREEDAEGQVVSRLNVCGDVTMLDTLDTQFGYLHALPGELFCAVTVPCNLTLDTAEGLMLKQVVHSGLIAPLSSNSHNSKVYEAKILPEKSENIIYLNLTKKCCSDLGLKSNELYQMEVQFQQDRRNFCTMHRAVDLLPDTKKVLPDLMNCQVPLVPQGDVHRGNLNAKQLSALNFIIGTSSNRKAVAPLLIYGPFGTGKTSTLATAARELCKQPGNKVLICTYTNSSADLYIRDHLHPFIDKCNDEIRPIRIKSNKQGSALHATDRITLQYCLLSEDRQNFQHPTKALLDGHKIVITTTSMATHFQKLKLPEGYFTHILIDEASQMLECEALIPLGLAGPKTRVVLAGDHMQMGPKLFSVNDSQCSNHTILNRLFHYYQEQECDAAQQSRVIFSENYRSTKDIVEFVSTHFYVGKNDVIKAAGNVPPPKRGHALSFQQVRGECLLNSVSMSWYNKEEAAEVVHVVREILKYWPSEWGVRDEASISVLSEGFQVQQIRTELRRFFPKVHVQTYANVQGKQYRAIVMTTVHSRDRLMTSQLPVLAMFNDARVINTAMTRAQSQVVVVGDAAALCCFGACSGFWKSYIDHCMSKGSVAPSFFTKEFFGEAVRETAKFQKSVPVDEVNTLTDAIIQEMKDEYEQQQEECSLGECSSVKDCSEQRDIDDYSSRVVLVDSGLSELVKRQPNIYKQGRLMRQSHDRGYVVPFDDPAKRIHIKGMKDLGQAFSGDEVILRTAGEVRILGITKRASSQVFLCFLEDEDYTKPKSRSQKGFFKRMLVPITRSAPKICIHVKRLNIIPIRRHSHGQWKIETFHDLSKNPEQNVFQVEVITWEDKFRYPLGNVTNVFPCGRSLDQALWLLKQEYEVAPTTFVLRDADKTDVDKELRQDMRDVTTFTIDPKGANDLDDAISVRDNGERYELGVHVADVASFVSQGGPLDEDVKQRGTTYYCSQKPLETIHMFSEDCSKEFSLLEHKDRRVVSLMFDIQKKTHKIIGKPRFQLSLIQSDRQLTYEEAEDIITKGCKEGLRFTSVNDCVTVAHCFAKTQRKGRRDWPYAQPDDHRSPGKRKAQLMIEEMNVLFNTHTAKTLIASVKTRNLTPLRCQAPPCTEKLDKFKEQWGELIPLSFYVRHRLDHEEEAPHFDDFCILIDIWEDIRSAAEAGDTDKMVDLIAADDIHPLLQPVVRQFRRCQSKANHVRYNHPPIPADRFRHYAEDKDLYSQASSPIRRYLDVVLQRLLHSVISGRDVQYSGKEIDILCNEFEHKLESANDFEHKAEQLVFAESVKTQNIPKLAIVVSADPDEDSFSLSLPFNRSIFPKGLQVMYKDLQIADIPSSGQAQRSITLKWKKRIYAADDMNINQQLQRSISGPCIRLPMTDWKATIEAIDNEDWDDARRLMMAVNARRQECQPESSHEPETPENHVVDIELQLQPGDTLQIQMTRTEPKRCYQLPAVQLLHIKPKFQICVNHVQSAISCFSKPAHEPAKPFYDNVSDYVDIWKPLCEMESVASAVDESDSILVENLQVVFKQELHRKLTGSFTLPEAWIEEWASECSLSRCLLCIRKTGMMPTSTTEYSAPGDPTEITWVAHAVTTKATNLESGEFKVEFTVHLSNQLPMESSPQCFHKNTRFTVEIIPKLLPDIRKKEAVRSLRTASDLVQNIAVGRRILERGVQNTVTKREIMTERLGIGPSILNNSQYLAVDQALKNSFTLIQGPPGTGKTVVGAHIVYWFVVLNSRTQRALNDPKDKDKNDVVLYCGPSNKSVDVISEYLMRLGDKLKPLRVYSQRVEMLDYPYPECNMQVSPRALRQEPSNPELRDITLHHRMRLDQNPFSGQIKEFDRRIKNKEKLTNVEVKEYKGVLRKARKYEYRQHDVILCTCVQSSTPGLTKTLSARQILIDECAMATEPETLIPLVCNNPEKIVLIGDHKQLQPVVTNIQVKKLGMGKSLFQRHVQEKTLMLDIQYRMHDDICRFPSEAYYDGRLQTGAEQRPSVLCVNDRSTHIVFGDMVGTTVRQVNKTAKGNFNSKANREERDIVVSIATKLVRKGKVAEQDIVILSPYNAQVSEIRALLREKKMSGITVTTITKSQGSEWPYVLMSMVCSLPKDEIMGEPDGAFLSKHLGSVGFSTQINVGVTRAKQGLCIIGNAALLGCSRSWIKLLDHYRRHNALADVDKISVVPHNSAPLR